ncbi:MarR family winged helix-turn-helix transcriptional regulator [Crocinitomix catalasitica]|uniref:MarR family winged helix-turn-helix transcriptional regulator n=1 Tax=Crocinitomix catalasitica TaxID=184607 RepID=UPI000486D8E7|nr:MarR family transcriptional regulator [Crocinitomix catalasitica]
MESTLVQLVKYYEKFKTSLKADVQGDNMTKFIAYLNSEVGTESSINEEVKVENWKNLNRKTLLEMTSAYLGKMGRYVDNYCRKNLPETPLGSMEEFTYLITCMKYQKLTKSELIQHNIHPTTTGTDIIKRLLKKGFIKQSPNLEDKRSTCIEITDQGRGAIFSTSGTLNKLSIISAGILSNNELILLVGMLQKLDQFHETILHEHKEMDLDLILSEKESQIL